VVNRIAELVVSLCADPAVVDAPAGGRRRPRQGDN
jgi:hypothetical protein